MVSVSCELEYVQSLAVKAGVSSHLCQRLPLCGMDWSRKRGQGKGLVHGAGAGAGTQLSLAYYVLVQNSEASMKSKFKLGPPGH